jgi:hypothetical protein
MFQQLPPLYPAFDNNQILSAFKSNHEGQSSTFLSPSPEVTPVTNYFTHQNSLGTLNNLQDVREPGLGICFNSYKQSSFKKYVSPT